MMTNTHNRKWSPSAALPATLVVYGLAVTLAIVHRWFLHVPLYEFWLEATGHSLIYATIGALILSRRPGHLIGWLFTVVGLSSAVQFLLGQYAMAGPTTGLAGGAFAAWLATWGTFVNIFGYMVLMLLFPTGRLPSRRWRAVAWLIGIAFAYDSLLSALRRGPLGPFPTVENPYGFVDAAALERAGVTSVLGLLFPLALLASLASPFVRMRSARGQERQQLKMFAFAGPIGLSILLVPVLLLLLFPGLRSPDPGFVNVGSIMWTLAPLALPIGATIAIMRYRLYDIDFIIRRTLIYALLTAMLAAIYFGGVVTLQQFFRALTGQGSNQLAVVASTMAIVALFHPLRRRIQASIDRRFYRRKYNAGVVLAAFGVRLRDEVDQDRLTEALLSVVQDTLNPGHASLWLREPRGSSRGSLRSAE